MVYKAPVPQLIHVHLFFSGISGSGKTASITLLVDQILRLSAHSKREGKIAEQIKAFSLVLESFGNAKTPTNPNTSRYTRFTELHFNDRGRIRAARILAFGLDKSRLTRLSLEERSYHVFYQLLSGATPPERDSLGLEGPSEYTLLASSSCYRLPAGPLSDDGIAMDNLREALKTLGFKSKHTSSIFSIVAAILFLGNIEFGESDAQDESAYVLNVQVLRHAAKLLGVSADELTWALTCRTSYVRKELLTVLLDAKQSVAQRDQLVQGLYAILFAFIVETANYKLAPIAQTPTCSATQVVLFDHAGSQTRSPSTPGSVFPLISTLRSGFEQFCVDFTQEVVEEHVLRSIFDDSATFNTRAAADGIPLPVVSILDSYACAQLLRGPYASQRTSRKPGGMLGVIDKVVTAYKSGRGDLQKDNELWRELASNFASHPSFLSSSTDESTFTIKHYTYSCSYDVSCFVEKDADLFDPSFVTCLRNSSDPLVMKLVSGPGLSMEKHQSDPETIVQVQVSSRPMRNVMPLSGTTEASPRLNPNKIYAVTTQLNQTLQDVLSNIEGARLWTMTCISPNDHGTSNFVDKHRVQWQIRALKLPEIIFRRSNEFVADFRHAEFCERYRLTIPGSSEERIQQCESNGWKQGVDFAIGHERLWLSYYAWKMMEDVVRSAEKEHKIISRQESAEDEFTIVGDTDYPHTSSDDRDHGLFDEPPIVPRPTPGTPGLCDGFVPSRVPSTRAGYPEDSASVLDKITEGYVTTPSLLPKTSLLTPVDSPEVFEEHIPTTRLRRYWLYLVRLFTWWIPDFLLTYIGRMKRPDVRIAWREKVTIFILIFLANALVLFYIIVFGIILCPDFDKAWASNEVAQHAARNDYYVSVQGRVFDVSKFVKGDHSDVTGQPSNSAVILDGLAGTDMTYYFPPPLQLACAGLVSDPHMQITIKNTSQMTYPTALHISGVNALYNPSALENVDWYTTNFIPAIGHYYKGPLVWEPSEIYSQANDTTIQR